MFKYLKSFIKHHPIWTTTICVFIPIIAFPIIVDFVYIKGASSSSPILTNYSASDILSYWGSILAFIGTVALGALAIWQNHIIENNSNKYNNKILKLTAEQKHQGVRPFLTLDDIDYCLRDNELEFYIRNEGIGFALNIICEVIQNSKVFFTETYARLGVSNESVSKLNLIAEQLSNIISTDNSCRVILPEYDNYIDIETHLPDIPKNNFEFSICLTYENIYGKKYKSIYDIEYDSTGDKIISYNEKFIE